MRSRALRRNTSTLVVACLLLATTVTVVRAQSPPPLQPNSGINASDTYVTADITIHNQATLNLQQKIHNAQTNSDATSVDVSGTDTHYHIEAGYDTSNHMVFNMYPTDAAADPTTSLTDSISKLQYANGTATVYDLSGSPIANALPQDPNNPTAATSAPVPSTMLGLMPGPSVLDYLVTGDPNRIAAETGGTLQASGSTDQVTIPSHLSGGGPTIWTYQSGGSGWTMSQSTVTRSTTDLQMTTSIVYANMGWNQNTTADNARRSLASTAQTPPGDGTATAPAAGPMSPDTTTPSAAVQTFANGAQNVVFQHGFASSGQTWNRMRNWLNPLFEFGGESVPSLPSTDHLANQATDLVNLLAGSQRDSLFIAHSNGGLVSRDVAQRRPDLATGVLTLDTPHNGVLLDLTGQAALAAGVAKGINALANIAGCSSPSDNIVCALAFFLFAGSPALVNFAFDSVIPATSDVLPFGLSPYLNNLNAASENFVRVGIEGHSDKRWLLERLIGDSRSNPDDTFGGRNVARATQAVFGALILCAIIANLFGDFELAARCLGAALIMKAIDVFWNVVVSGTDSSDGIVHGAGQVYNNATARYVISGSDSHVGVTRSDKDRDRVIDALDRQFFVPRTGCQFLLSPNSTSVSGAGGSASFAVNVAQGSPSTCEWTAVSDSPWITVPAGTHGAGSGTVSFSFAANPSSTAGRSGVINLSGLTFTVNQIPFPDFQLNVAPSAQTIRAGQSTSFTVSGSALNGFNGSVSLSAAISPGGPSVSLSSSSINVNPGGSSTATLTLGTTTSTTPQSYAVTVTASGGGQTHSAAVALNVQPPPAPATGSIAISWGLGTCDPSNTCQSGDVWVAIGGTPSGGCLYSSPSFSVHIDMLGQPNGINDPQSLAQAIASNLNATGLVNANPTVDGSGNWSVSMVTTGTGTDKNYPIATWETGTFGDGSQSLLGLNVSGPQGGTDYGAPCAVDHLTGGQ